MKKFKFKFSLSLTLLLVLLILISGAGVTINLVRFFNPLLNSYHGASNIILAVLSLALIVVALLVLFNSKYEFKKGELYFTVGLIKIKLGLKQVISVREYKGKTLYLVFSDAKFTVVLISPSRFNEFIKIIKKQSPKIFIESIANED